MLYLKNFLASVHYLNHPIISALGALALLLLGIFVLTRDTKSKLYRIFFFLMCAIAIWFGGNALSMLYYENFDLAILWFKIGYTGVCFMATVYYHFYLIQTKKTERNLLYVLYFISILEIIFLWSFDIKIGAYALPNVGVIWRGTSTFFLFLFFSMVKYIIVTLLAAIALLIEYKKAGGLEKKRLQWLTVFFFALVLGSIEWLAIFDIPLHIGWIAIPFALGPIAYAIVKHQLMDIRVVIKKAFIYSVVVGVISGGVMGISFLNSWFIKNIPGFQFWTVPLIVAIVSFLIGNLFWRKSKEADKLKYEFITIAAHKLRTPLTKIKWAAKELSEEIKIGENKNLISQIMRSNEQLIELTDILLNTSKTEEEKYNKYMYELTPVSLEELTKDILLDVEDQIKLKDIKIVSNFKKNLAKVNVDKERINSVIQILLENAVIYSIKGGEIKISLGKDKENLIFSVKDNGIGIPKKDQPYIFFKFFRADNVKTVETEGSGLGLVLAKNIIERHGGKIGFESKGENKGTKFWFSLPLV